MKKLFASIALMAMLTIVVPMSANAQIGRKSSYRARTYQAQTYQRPSFYRRHRNLINVGIGAGAGALLGGLFGGKKGAAIGALAGGGGGALYTYKIRPKKRRY